MDNVGVSPGGIMYKFYVMCTGRKETEDKHEHLNASARRVNVDVNQFTTKATTPSYRSKEERQMIN
jgi:hypothetical protein